MNEIFPFGVMCFTLAVLLVIIPFKMSCTKVFRPELCAVPMALILVVISVVAEKTSDTNNTIYLGFAIFSFFGIFNAFALENLYQTACTQDSSCL